MKVFNYTGKGRKKTSVSKVIIYKGNGKIFSNILFYTSNMYKILVDFLENKFNIRIYSKGGGLKSKIKSVEFALSNVLLKIKPNYKKIIKYMNLVSDLRVIERKKVGFVKSRKRKQFSKR